MNTLNLEKLSEMLRRFYRAFHIPVSLYVSDTPLFSYTAIVFEPDLAFLFLKKAFNSDNKKDANIFYSSHHDIHCGMVRIIGTEQYILVGPVSFFSPTLQQCSSILSNLNLPLSKKRELLYILRKAPRFDYGSFVSLLIFLDFIINGSTEIPVDVDEIEITPEQKEHNEDVLEFHHNSHELENDILKAIEEGRSDDLLKLLLQVRSSGVSMGITAKDSTRNLRNAFITSASLVSRAAIRGGLDYEYALTLCDSYIYDMENLNKEIDIYPLIGLMMIDFCDHIAKLNKPENCSSLTAAVLDDINRHLHGSLTVADIAERLHRSISYISHTFEQELHIPLKQYILQQKVKEAQYLLSLECYSISEISALLGFSSQSHFQTAFKKITGITPGKYKKT